MHLELFVKRVYGDKDYDLIKGKTSDREKIQELIDIGRDREDIINQFEKYYGCNYVDIDYRAVPKEILNYLDIEKLKKLNIFPFDFDEQNRRISVASSKSENKDILALFNSLDINVDLYFAFDFEIIDALNRQITVKEIEKTVEVATNITDDVVSWVDKILRDGIKKKASDIHIEIKKDFVYLRYRVDGILTFNERFSFSATDKSKIVNKIKTMSGLDISEKRKPQDGRIGDYLVGNMRYDLRVSTVATVVGEKIVLRIVDKDSPIMTFEELGFKESDIKKIKKALNNTNGIIYIGGATGSGKTTTLYTMIKEKDNKETNIYSVEDPVEKEIETINQVTINDAAGITYASTLRALLRQDPDVMVIGEVRDIETAELSSNASLAGHLILTTIHANSALDTLNRLYELGLEPYLVSSSCLLLMSQRLIRPLCECKKHHKLTSDERDWILSIIESYDLDYKIEDFENMYEAVGCDNCNKGYSGRYAIAEILEVNEEITNMIHRKANINEIKEIAVEKYGFESFGERILKDLIHGKTSVKEAMSKIN